MKKYFLAAVMVFLIAGTAHQAAAQNEVEPNDLKISPPKYKNAYIKVQDQFIHLTANVPWPLPQAGYSLDRYLTFGAMKAGIRCFLRRGSANEEAVSQLKNGDRITIYGRIRQPRATVGQGIKIRGKTERYIFEVAKLEKGWE